MVVKNDIDIECEDLVVEFPIFDKISRSVKAQITSAKKSKRSFRALDNLNVTIKAGETVGLLGRNGAGKTTFLHTLAGVYVPESGRLDVNDTTTSIFNIATGTDPDASGYDNIPLLMATRGIDWSERDLVIKDVEDFTELGDALARPMRTYSQGMKLRISFAVATYQIHGILLMDEIVGVGDRQFADKSKERIRKVIDQAGTLVLASHSPTLLKTHCERGLVFSEGKIIFDGEISEAINFLDTQKPQTKK